MLYVLVHMFLYSYIWSNEQRNHPVLSRDDTMGLLSDTWNCGLRIRRECRERFVRHRGLAIQACDARAVMHARIAN